jgi:hypothetical protein
MSGGAKRNSDKLNTVGIVVVGICGSALVYVSIALLQAFYMNDTSDVQMMADYGGQDTQFQTARTQELANITQCANVLGSGNTPSKHSIPVENAMRLVVEDARKDPSILVPQLGRADKPTIKAQFDRPVPLGTPAPATPPADPNAATAPAAPVDPAAAPAPGAATTLNAVAPMPGATAPVAPPAAGGTVPGAAAPTAPATPATPPPAR